MILNGGFNLIPINDPSSIAMFDYQKVNLLNRPSLSLPRHANAINRPWLGMLKTSYKPQPLKMVMTWGFFYYLQYPMIIPRCPIIIPLLTHMIRILPDLTHFESRCRKYVKTEQARCTTKRTTELATERPKRTTESTTERPNVQPNDQTYDRTTKPYDRATTANDQTMPK